MSAQEAQPIQYMITQEQQGVRLDKAIAALADDLSRARVQALIAQDAVKVNGLLCNDASRKMVKGSVIEIDLPPLQEAAPQAEDIALDIVYEDEHLLVINKHAGLVVHPGAGNPSGTLVNALIHHCGDSLSGIGGVMRPGIVHRLDKDTSGLMVVAKNDHAHKGLAAQLEDRSLSRVYHALVLRVPIPPKGVIDMPIGRDPRNRLKMAIKGRDGREARTHYHVRASYGQALSLVECKLETGRTHQIRVHMQALKHPLIGDPLYTPQDTAIRASMKKAGYMPESIEAAINFPRQALHAQSVSFVHPVSEDVMSFTADLPEDFCKLLKTIDKK